MRQKSLQYIEVTPIIQQYCHVGNQAIDWRRGLFQDADFSGNLSVSKSKSGDVLCIYGTHSCSMFLLCSFFVWCCCFSFSFWWGCFLSLPLGGAAFTISSVGWCLVSSFFDVFFNPFAWCCLVSSFLLGGVVVFGWGCVPSSLVGWCFLVSSSLGWSCCSSCRRKHAAGTAPRPHRTRRWSHCSFFSWSLRCGTESCVRSFRARAVRPAFSFP